MAEMKHTAGVIGIDFASGPNMTSYKCGRCGDCFTDPNDAEGCRDPQCPMLAAEADLSFETISKATSHNRKDGRENG